MQGRSSERKVGGSAQTSDTLKQCARGRIGTPSANPPQRLCGADIGYNRQLLSSVLGVLSNQLFLGYETMNKAGFAGCALAYGVLTLIGAMIWTPAQEADTAGLVGAAQSPAQPAEVGHPSLMSPHASPIATLGDHVFVANTAADTVDVIDAQSAEVINRIAVGVDPVSIAVRPDGKEVWVANHVSDSVSVIDTDPESVTYLHTVATVQQFDLESNATRFDEPVGIAFADNEKAYVALSSENQIAVVDVATRQVTGRIDIPAQDPRVIKVVGNRLFVIPFESNNQTQLSGGSAKDIDGKLVTFDAYNHSILNNNVLSLGHVLDIVKHPQVPDRDLFVFDTATDTLIETVDTLGTLLYGMAVDSNGHVYIAQTDARNDVNGRSGTKKHGLKELENRAFLNQITSVGFDGDSARRPQRIDLEPLPPEHPRPDQALATPFGIEASEDDSTLVVTAAASDKVFTVDPNSGNILGRVTVAGVPRGIALRCNGDGKPATAWVFSAVANTVSHVDLADPTQPHVIETIALDDPTHPTFKQGRLAFNSADASTTGTFACASCHPDGHTDQLLWVLQTPIVTGGDQIMPRSTMPVRGLRDTAPFHWDGIPGDPYGGHNSACIGEEAEPNCDINDPASATRHLIDAGLATTMHTIGDETVNDEGKVGRLSAAERDAMAKFLLGVPYPPSQRRPYNNVVTDRAREGFELFHIWGNYEGKPQPNVCGDCHRMPFWVSTNTPGTGMDTPTWRGAYDRFLILPQGRINIIEFNFFESLAEQGIPEREIWKVAWRRKDRFDPVWDMVLEGSTGFAGAFARQLTLSTETVEDELAADLLPALELAAREGAVLLEVDGAFIDDRSAEPVVLQFHADEDGGKYIAKRGQRRALTGDELTTLAGQGQFIGTFTARHGKLADIDHPQPALWTLGPIHEQRGRQKFPMLYPGKLRMTVNGRHIDDDARIYLDGRRADGQVRLEADERVVIEIAELPATGMHLLQLQNSGGMFSNDFIFHATRDAEHAKQLWRLIRRKNVEPSELLVRAIDKSDAEEVRELLQRGASIDDLPDLDLAQIEQQHPEIAKLLEKSSE